MTTTDLKPIPTRYRGCHFRSRLEARWAVFFDYLGIQWEYEPQGYELPSGRRYLPDFRLTSCGVYVEVKGQVSDLDLPLLWEAAEWMPHVRGNGEDCQGLILLGQIPWMDRNRPLGDWAWPILCENYVPFFTSLEDIPPSWVIFGRWSKNYRPWFVEPVRQGSPPYLTPRWDTDEGEALMNDTEGAYIAARSARFEHGESGAT